MQKSTNMVNLKVILLIIFSSILQTRAGTSKQIEIEDKLSDQSLNLIDNYKDGFDFFKKGGATQIFNVIEQYVNTGDVDSSDLFQLLYDIMKQNINVNKVYKTLGNYMPTEAIKTVSQLFKQYPQLMEFLKSISLKGRAVFETFRKIKQMETFENAMRDQGIDIDHIYNVLYNVLGWHRQ